MKPIKVYEASGAVLDWMVLKALGHDFIGFNLKYMDAYPLSTDWAQGGPIIEREHISVTGHKNYTTLPDMHWRAYIQSTAPVYGPTILIAAMRCYITSKLGDTLEVPEELL